MIATTTPSVPRWTSSAETVGPDGIDAAKLVIGAERALDLGDRGLLAGVAAGLDAKAQERIGHRPDPLHFDGSDAKLLALGANRGDIRIAALGAHVDLRAAGEVDAEIHAHEQEHENRDDRQERRQRIAHAAEPHEAEFGVLGREPKQFHAASPVVRLAPLISGGSSAASGGTRARSSSGSW